MNMTQSEKRKYLIQYLLDENKRYKGYEIPTETDEQKSLLRALMNVRMPGLISNEFLSIQDDYLKEEIAKGGIVDIKELTPVNSDDRIILWQGDITTLKVDAIVNAANSQMCGCFQPNHNCIDNIIHTKAGIQLRLKCHDIMEEQGYEEPTGQAKITPAYNLPCKYVIHTVGPIVQGRLIDEHRRLLESSYRSCLEIAEANDIESIAFCCISTGVFMFPNDIAADIAVKTVKDFLNNSKSVKYVIFNVFKDVDLDIYSNLLSN